MNSDSKVLQTESSLGDDVEVDSLKSAEDVDDIESDVLPSDDEEGSDDEGDYEETASVREENEYYMSFLRSVFLDDANSERSATDGDDDEEYNAIEEEEEEGSSGDENDEEAGFVEVSKKEVQDLVHSSWHAIADARKVNATNLAADGTVDPNVLITHILKQLLSGSKDSPEIRFNDIPIENVRQLATRQMSMALQLMLQMLLLSEDRSHCEKLCSQYLMELSNYAVRKSALILNQYSSIVDYVKTHHMKALEKRDASDAACAPEASVPTITHSASAPITRTAIASKFQGVSCFDIPLLQDIDAVFQEVDKSRRAVRLASAAADPSTAHINALHHMRSEVETILSLWNMRTWKCLMPTENYPLSHDTVQQINPRSLYGRHAFTPAEDDLLLRGIMFGNSLKVKGTPDVVRLGQSVNWEEVKKSYLCSKETQFLENRVMQLTGAHVPETSKFKRAQRLLQERRQKSIPWSSEEDVQLLLGFQAFGSKWNLIKLYFLPNRTHQQLRLRWRTLVNESPSAGGTKIDGDYTKSVRQFLERLRDNTIGFAGEERRDTTNNKSSELFISAEEIEEVNLLSDSDEYDDIEHIDLVTLPPQQYVQPVTSSFVRHSTPSHSRPPIVPFNANRKVQQSSSTIPTASQQSQSVQCLPPAQCHVPPQEISVDLGSNITNMLNEAMLALRDDTAECRENPAKLPAVVVSSHVEPSDTPKKRWSSMARLDLPSEKRTKSSSLFDSVMSATKRKNS